MLNKTVSLSIKQPLPLSVVQERLGLFDLDIKTEIETFIYDHYRSYHLEPLNLKYHRSQGYILSVNSYIGLIKLEHFNIEIQPKIDDLTIGKCLQLANLYSLDHLVHHSNSVVEKSLSDTTDLTNVEYFVAGFCSVLADLVRNGLITEPQTRMGNSRKIKGQILIQKTIQKGNPPLEPFQKWPVRSPNIPSNQTIKSAIICSLASTKNTRLKGILLALDRDFSEVQEAREFNYEVPGTIPRLDYLRTLRLAKIILEGFTSTVGDDASFFPSFTINLDELFETVVANGLKEVTKTLSIRSQEEIAHDIQPKTSLMKIIPDLIIKKVKGRSTSIILDTKNKYSQINETGEPQIANNDLFQISYYCRTLESKLAILVYPGNSENFTRYPIPGAESRKAYLVKRKKALRHTLGNARKVFYSTAPTSRINLVTWRINLAGTVADTKKSIAALALFVADAIDSLS